MDAPAPGTLFVVATPIGNLEDITLRALGTLREVALVAAEDTRRTGNLLRHYQIATPMLSLHAHNERHRVDQVVARLRAGDSIALATDAGTPGISDPGAALVKAVRATGLRVEPIPGPSALTAALSASGLEADRFAFGGFPPTVPKHRRAWFDWVAQLTVPVVCFEAPHRVRRTMTELGKYLGDRPIMVARELTKIHEEWLEGTAQELVERLLHPRGEYVLIVGPQSLASGVANAPTDEEIGHLFGQLTEITTASRREAITKTAKSLGISARAVYAALERLKNSVI